MSGTSFILAARLNGAFAQVARWFPDYPMGCTPGATHWNPEYIANIQLFARQAVEPLEHAAWIDVIAAAVVVAAMGTCALIWGRTRRAALQPLG